MGITAKDIQAQRELLERIDAIREAQRQSDVRELMRDMFAAAALTGLTRSIPEDSVYHADIVASQAYCLADAMLRERARKNHDAAPAARAKVASVRTDKAEPLHDARGVGSGPVNRAPGSGEGTGDTPSEAEIDALEFVVVNGHTASISDYGILRQWLIRLRPEFDIADADEDESDRPQPITTPAKTNPTPPRNGTPAEGSEQTRCSQSYTAGDVLARLMLWLSDDDIDDAHIVLRGAITEIAGLRARLHELQLAISQIAERDAMRIPIAATLTDAEREAVEQAIDAANGMGQAEPWTMRTLRGLLERLK